jgi:predicted esterase YcpF (UPF0227 family)
MIKIAFLFVTIFLCLNLNAANKDNNIKKQMELEKKYAKEQKFYMGEDYNLSAVEVDKDTVDQIQAIEPDYDFDITDLYRDDI